MPLAGEPGTRIDGAGNLTTKRMVQDSLGRERNCFEIEEGAVCFRPLLLFLVEQTLNLRRFCRSVRLSPTALQPLCAQAGHQRQPTQPHEHRLDGEGAAAGFRQGLGSRAHS